MIEQIYNYFTIEILYYWVNLGVLPFWLILIFFPVSYLCRYFVTSIFPIFILSSLIFSQPAVSFDPAEISVESATSSDISTTLSILNSGDSDLNWSAEVTGDVHYELDAYEGVTSSGATTTLTLSNPSTDNPIGGTYESNIRFITNDPVNAITDIGVTIVLTGTPSISINISIVSSHPLTVETVN